MPTAAFQAQYRQEYIKTFEVEQSLLRKAVTTEGQLKGNQIIFQVAGSGGATAVTRGVNGLITPRANDLTGVTLTLTEWHDLVRVTGFDIFATQGDQRALMQRTTQAVLNRKIDDQILTELDTTTLGTSLTGQTASLNMVVHAKTILGNLDVPLDGQLMAVISPAFEAYLMQTKEFASVDYVSRKPFDAGEGSLTMFRWAGVNFIVHPNISGVGTSAEKCFLWHRSAIGHGMDIAGMQTPVGYDEEQNYSWARASAFMGAKVLQGNGIVQMTHDGSGFASVSV